MGGPEPWARPDPLLTLGRPAWVMEPAQYARPREGVCPRLCLAWWPGQEAARREQRRPPTSPARLRGAGGMRGAAAAEWGGGGRQGERQLAASGKVFPGLRSRARRGAGDLPPTISSVAVVGERKLHSYWK